MADKVLLHYHQAVNGISLTYFSKQPGELRRSHDDKEDNQVVASMHDEVAEVVSGVGVEAAHDVSLQHFSWANVKTSTRKRASSAWCGAVNVIDGTLAMLGQDALHLFRKWAW